MPPPLNFRPKKGPEAKIQEDLINYLKIRNWYVKHTHGNLYQSGFPDLFIAHSVYGQKWVEVKNAEKYAFTPAQIDNFPKMCAYGAPIWVLTAATDEEYAKLFRPYNWFFYLQVLR